MGFLGFGEVELDCFVGVLREAKVWGMPVSSCSLVHQNVWSLHHWLCLYLYYLEILLRCWTILEITHFIYFPSVAMINLEVVKKTTGDNFYATGSFKCLTYRCMILKKYICVNIINEYELEYIFVP